MSLNFAILIKAVDEATGVIGKVNGALENVSRAAGGYGERLTAAGEQMTLMGGIAQAGAEGLMRGVEKVIEPATAMQERLAALSAQTSLTAAQLGRVHEHAEKFSESAAGYAVSAEDYVGVFSAAYRTLGDFTEAQQAADEAVKLSAVTGISAAQAMQTQIAMHEDLGASARETNRVLGAVIRQYALGPESMRSFTYAMARSAGAARLTHTSMSELGAVMGEASQMLPGGRGAQLFASLLAELPKVANKAGLDMSHGLIATLGQIRSAIAGAAPGAQAQMLQQMGFAGAQGTMLVTLLGNLDKIQAAQANIAGAHYGTFASELAARSATMAATQARLWNALAALMDAAGSTALPALTRWVQMLASGLVKLQGWVEGHKRLVGAMVEAAAAIAPVTLGAASLLLTLGPILILLGGVSKVFSALSYVPAIFSALSAAVSGATWAVAGLATGSETLGTIWAAMMETNPIGWILTAVAVIGVAGYELYKHWDAVRALFARFYHFLAALDWKVIGLRILHDLLAPIEWATHGIERLLGIHSAAPPAPGAVGAVAALGEAGTYTVSAPRSAAGRPGAGAQPARVVTIHHAPAVTVHVHGGDPANVHRAVVDALHDHVDEIRRAIKHQDEIDARAAFAPAAPGWGA